MATIQYYYPEGVYGPICDYTAPEDLAGGIVPQRILEDADAQDTFDDLFTLPVTDGVYWPNRVRCKTRIADDGEIEYYDCEAQWDIEDPNDGNKYNGTDCLPSITGKCYNFEDDILTNFGIDDTFFVVDIGPIGCQPYVPDYNIRPITFRGGDGSETIKYAREKSSPVTFPVNAVISETSQARVTFDSTGYNLVVDNDATIIIELSWDDDPSTAGTAVTSITIDGVTWTQSGTSGSQTEELSLVAGTYPITYVGLNSRNTPINVTDSSSNLCLRDGDGNDCNANFRITAVQGGVRVGQSLWGENGDTYGVWVNPAECTLPCQLQQVTYFIDFPETDVYYFEFGADDQGKIFIDDETQPALNIVDGITANGLYRDPWLHSRTVTAGRHKVLVECTNSNPFSVTQDDNMRAVDNALLVRTDGSEERLSLGFEDINGNNYFSAIAKAVADEYLSGRFGRTESVVGEYAARGRPPEPTGMTTHVDYYIAAGGSLTDNPVDPTYWADTKTNSIVSGYNLGEVNAADVLDVYYPSCGATPNGIADVGYNANSWSWASNPGGWYLKICKGGPCSVAQQVTDWYRVVLGSPWSNLMNSYAVWPSLTDQLAGSPQTLTIYVTVVESDTYTLTYAADNEITLYWDGTQVAQLTGDVFNHYATDHTVQISVTPGTYPLTMVVNNIANSSGTNNWSDNPAGGAWLLTNSNGAIIKSSADFSSSGSTNLIWHTRLATGYEYIEI